MSRNGAGIAHQTPLRPVLDDAIATPLTTAIVAFRAVEGEKTLNQLLHTLLLESNEKLQRYGVQTAFRESAELESLRAQLKRQQDANKHGNEEFRKLQHAANQLAQDMETMRQMVPDEDLEKHARQSIQAWETATSAPQPLAS